MTGNMATFSTALKQVSKHNQIPYCKFLGISHDANEEFYMYICFIFFKIHKLPYKRVLYLIKKICTVELCFHKSTQNTHNTKKLIWVCPFA